MSLSHSQNRSGGEKWVTCPYCQGPSRYASSNAYRPFCSQRCQQADLGAWASEQFVLAKPAESDDEPPWARH